jgi:uncharacterized protein YjbJ (UPF0337 family)
MEQDMNIDRVIGEGTELKGKFKESLGNATGDTALQNDGAADQLSGKARQGFGALRDFVRDQPLAAAAVAGLVGLVLFNGSRGNNGRGRRGF